jgi:gamma-glutamyltranspeptidase/glutathione hydrolase
VRSAARAAVVTRALAAMAALALALACAMAVGAAAAGAADVATVGAAPTTTAVRPAAPGRAAIASAHPLATAAGLEVLRAGGNAFDAAVAVSAALAVVEPTGSGLTGGGIYLLHRQQDGFETAIDAREFAPAAASRDMFLDAQGNPVPDLSTRSALAAGIPGEPAGLALLAARYGRLPVAQSLAPAIRLAREGFPQSEHLHGALQSHLEQFRAEPEVARNFLHAGAVPPVGTLVRQPELAATLEYLAHHGLDSFYHGEFAARLVAGVRAQQGIWTEADLAAYRALERAPIVGQYRGARVVSAPPPSSGGIALVEALNLLGQFDLRSATAVERKHLVIEAMRRVHRDRALYLGDPDFVTVPVARLTSADYAAGLAASIRNDRATPSSALPGLGAGANAGAQTTHFSVLDRDGNRVAATITLNFGFGSGRMIAGTGLFLNNEMDDFSMKPGVPNGYGLVGADANAIAPHKRMLSSVTPSFVESGDRVMIGGSPGGSLIIGMVLLATLDFVDGHSASEIVAAPRFHEQYLPDVVRYEAGAFSDEELRKLTAQGDTLQPVPYRWGNFQLVIWNRATGAVDAASDPRGEGAWVVE